MAKNSKKTGTLSAVTAVASATAAAQPALNAAALFKVSEAAAAGTIAYLSQDEAAGLIAAGLIEVNAEMADPNDASKRAARLTDAGHAEVASLATSEDESTDEEDGDEDEGDAFEIDDGVVMGKRGGGGGASASKFPFAKLAIGQSFHVKLDGKEHQSKNMSSAASQYARQFDKPVFDDAGNAVLETVNVRRKNPDDTWSVVPVTRQKALATIKFAVREVGDDDKRGKGIRVFRVAL